MKAVILAGGQGTRLRPYTVSIPKPLVPVGEKPIMEIVIEDLKGYGITEFIVCIGYLADMIKSYFNNGSKLGVNISYSQEAEPLGTAGPLGLIKGSLNKTFLLINGDTLTTLNFKEFYDFHKRSGAVATLFAKDLKHRLNLGVIDANGEHVVNYREKPELHNLVSTGIYFMEPEVLKYIKPGKKLDLPELIMDLIKDGKKVVTYKNDAEWLDIGRPEDYEAANANIESILTKMKSNMSRLVD